MIVGVSGKLSRQLRTSALSAPFAVLSSRGFSSHILNASTSTSTSLSSTPNAVLIDLVGVHHYESVWRWQKDIMEGRIALQKSRNLLLKAFLRLSSNSFTFLSSSLWSNRLSSLYSELNRFDRDVIFLVEHDHIITLGRGNTQENLLFDSEHGPPSPYRFLKVDRGGEVTAHLPGQQVIYPILDLSAQRFKSLQVALNDVNRSSGQSQSAPASFSSSASSSLSCPLPSLRCDLHWYLRSLEEVVIVSLERLLPKSCHELIHRSDGFTGVWFNQSKVCAVGCNASRWITSHGLALNVVNDLTAFRRFIIPCGLNGKSVTSVEEILLENASDHLNHHNDLLNITKQILVDSLQQVFGLHFERKQFAKNNLQDKFSAEAAQWIKKVMDTSKLLVDKVKDTVDLLEKEIDSEREAAAVSQVEHSAAAVSCGESSNGQTVAINYQ